VTLSKLKENYEGLFVCTVVYRDGLANLGRAVPIETPAYAVVMMRAPKLVWAGLHAIRRRVARPSISDDLYLTADA
jgi:hypothetical protein